MIEWKGDACYFTAANGLIYRVYDTVYRRGWHVPLKPGTGDGTYRVFVPARSRIKTRTGFFEPAEHEVTVPNLERMCARASQCEPPKGRRVLQHGARLTRGNAGLDVG